MEEEERLFLTLAENVLYLWACQKLESKLFATESLKPTLIKKKKLVAISFLMEEVILLFS